MTNNQKESFKELLLKLKKSVEEEMYIKYEYENDIEKFKDDEDESSDEGDLASQANIIAFETKKQLLLKKQLNEINLALSKIEHNIYGICEESGEPIELKRLLANPTARFSIEVQQLLEKGY